MKTAVLKGLLLLPDGALCQVYEGFHVLFCRGEFLELTLVQGPPPGGRAVEEAQMELPEGYALSLTGNKKGFILKRLSQGDSPVEITDYGTEMNGAGDIILLETRGTIRVRHVWGTGERYHAVDMRGSATSGRVEEKFTRQGETTYLPVPFFMTEKGVACFRDTSLPVEMDFGEVFVTRQAVSGPVLIRERWFFGTPDKVLRQMIISVGKPQLPPPWAFGVWISANGWNCDAEVDAQLDALKRYDYPADVMVLEAWSDERTFWRWNDREHWKDPARTIRRIREAGLHPVLWQIPVIKQERDGESGPYLAADEWEAIEKGYCVLREDGSPYRIPEGVWFSGSLLPDFTNPEAVKWWFGKRKYLLDMGIEGFKTDGGEFLLDDTARLHNGMRGREAHNLYPGQYISAYQDFLRANGVEGVTFSRADSTGAWTRPLHWAGDQLSTWEELQAQLRAGITAGLSGILFWGFDMGGFAGALPDRELYLRATALGCFSPVMQWHAEPRSGQFYVTHAPGFVNDRSPWNLAEKLGDPEILTICAAFARLRRKLMPCLIREAAFCVETCRPMMAHLCLDYPGDEQACAISDQYMLGRSLMVCPVVEAGRESRRVWLPRGRWRHFFTGEVLQGGTWMEFSCPLHEIIVLEKI